MASLLEQFQAQEQSAKAANLKRYEQAMSIYDEIISRYRPGGEFGKAALGQLEKRKVTDVGKETQQLISSGLYGTTTMGATGRRWEEAVGGPERLKLEDIQMQRLSQAQVGKAGFIERREDIGPDYGMIAQMAGQVGAGGYGGVSRAAPSGPYPSISGIENWRQLGSPFGAVKTTPATGGAGGMRDIPGAGVSIPMGEPSSSTYYGAAAGGAQEPYIEGKNYAYMLRQKTGETLSQREAYAKLQGGKKKTFGPPTPYYRQPSKWLGTA